MKATAWLCPVLTLLCATRLVCTTHRGPLLDSAASNMIQDDFLLDKRNKPSLSIVNPLDVLRQRLLLEIARRQMKENTRQVELNRAILKNVGKRVPMNLQYSIFPKEHRQNQPFPSFQQNGYLPIAHIFEALHRPVPDLTDENKKLTNMDITNLQLNGNELSNDINRKHVNGLFTDPSLAIDNGKQSSYNKLETTSFTDIPFQENSKNDPKSDYLLHYLYNLHNNHYSEK